MTLAPCGKLKRSPLGVKSEHLLVKRSSFTERMNS